MRLVEFEPASSYKIILLSPKPSFYLNPDGAEMELHRTFGLLRLDIQGSLFPAGLILTDQLDAKRRSFNVGCLKANSCVAASGTKIGNIEVNSLYVITLLSLNEEEPTNKRGRIWMVGGLPALF